MIIVTGGAGFIGSNIVRRLNEAGITEILVVDDLSDGHKAMNLSAARIADYMDHEEFLARMQARREFGARVLGVLHQGACTVTTEWDGRLMMRRNHEFSRELLHWCLAGKVPLVYASSASVYGAGREFRVAPECERPINVYAWSKLVFDQHARRCIAAARSQVVGLRYFNVYGPGEAHKAGMASVVWHFHNQLQQGAEVRLFEGSHGYGPGEQLRDFIHVDDIARANLWFLEHGGTRGIFNLGTGRARSFNDVARAVIAWHGRGSIRYVPFPPGLMAGYQSFTEADLSTLRLAGYQHEFIGLEDGVRAYLDTLAAAAP
ncbi:MAG: ADP-glyceromanno-heptose 6-epimerase [Gammaproteobacteria bacterium]|nr:MAG: ADP-glyceromanno-heptose 6-epimerase [Gammaproteobacteria bacterium]